jgi:aspartate aminotransferase-like enzyme
MAGRNHLLITHNETSTVVTSDIADVRKVMDDCGEVNNSKAQVAKF